MHVSYTCVQVEAGDSTSEAEQTVAASEVALDCCLLKLFNAAVRGDRLQQALEAACQLSQTRSLEGAIKLANHNRQTALADRIALFLETRLEAEAAEVDQVYRIVSSSPVTSKRSTHSQPGSTPSLRILAAKWTQHLIPQCLPPSSLDACVFGASL